MATTQNTYTGNGSTTNYSFTFPYLETTDIKATINGTLTTAFTLANATTVSFNTAPANGASIRIYRDTDDTSLAATFYTGSAIRAQDLNDNNTQILYKTQETSNYAIRDIGNISLAANYTFSGTVAGQTPTISSQFATKGYVDSVSLAGIPDGNRGDITVSSSGTVWTISTGAVTGADIASGAITDTNINASAAIADTKLATISTAGKVSGTAITSGNISTSGSIATTSTISDGSGSIRIIPQNSQTSAYTLAASDTGKHISITTGGVTVPTAFSGVGNVVTIYNNSGSSQTITQGASTTLRLGGFATTGNRTLAQYGVATILCVASNTFVITGSGLT